MPLPVISNLDDEDSMVAMERQFRARSRRQEERVIYYRRPRKGAMPGWIIWSDSQPGKRSDMIIRGFIPLPQYGRIHDGDDRDGRLFEAHGPWGAILSRPGGPAEFPADQVITYRWYRPENVGSPDLNKGQVAVPNVRFPQLLEHVKDSPIREFPCPECDQRTFLQAVHLARHLRNSHDWDRADILSWGAAIGVDFSREYKTRVVPVSYGDLVELPGEVDLELELAPLVAVETVAAPVRGRQKLLDDDPLAALE